MMKNIKLIFSDVDGVLTDGNLLIMNNGTYGKMFSTRDGQGIEMALKRGIKIYWITGRDDYASRIRAQELGVTYIFTNGRNKLDIVKEVLKKEKIKKKQALFIGDDIPDIVVSDELYFVCPQDANEKVRKFANLIIPKNGGSGVLRYVIDLILNEG